ncbi:putative Ig domain-containing protein [Paraglaciecola sp.]|uniref:putative Ig domain-containing protein n=1 Tax=Paraglaciecola sp. TaxID=1920173 RepID=UPI003EF1894A
MNAHKILKKSKVAAKVLSALPFALAVTQLSAKEPVIMNSAAQTDLMINAGFSNTPDSNDNIVTNYGVSSDFNAVQQQIILDHNNVPYSAYISNHQVGEEDDRALDGKLYVKKLVDNQWISANPANDTGAITDVAVRDDITNDNKYIKDNDTVSFRVSSKNEVHIAYTDAVGNVVIKKLALDEITSEPSAWVDVAKIEGTTSNAVRFRLDSNDNPWIMHASLKDGGIADAHLEKYDGSSWTRVGTRSSGIANWSNLLLADFALDSNDIPYVMFSNRSLGLDINGLYIQTVTGEGDTAVWTTVGSRAISTNNGGLGTNTRLVFIEMGPNDVPFIHINTHGRQSGVAKFDPTPPEDDPNWQNTDRNEAAWTVLGTFINTEFQQGAGAVWTLFTTFNIDNKGTPYLAYSDFNSRYTVPGAYTRVIRLGEALVDGVLTPTWQQMPMNDDVVVPNVDYRPRDHDIAFDSYNRPYVTYKNSTTTSGALHKNLAKVARAALENDPSKTIVFSVDEQSDETKFSGRVGRFEIESDTPVTLELIDDEILQDDLQVANLFDVDPTTHELKLKFIDDGRNGTVADDGINDNVGYFEIPSYSFKVRATNASGSVELPVNVQFNEVEEFSDLRPFAFNVFPTCPDTGCSISLNENEEVPLETIRSKIASYETTGTLPDGIASFGEETLTEQEIANGLSPRTGFLNAEGKIGNVSFVSGGASTGADESTNYSVIITAHPIADISEDPISLTVNLTINDVEMDVVFNGDIDPEFPDIPVPPKEPAEAYSKVMDEAELYSVEPSSTIAVKEYSIVSKPDWAKFDPLTGRLDGQPDYEDAGTYTGTITAHGYDGEAFVYPFTIAVNQVDLDVTPPFVDGEIQDAYLSKLPNHEDDEDTNNVNENIVLSIEKIILGEEDENYSFQTVYKAAKAFSITGQPGWATFDLNKGSLSGTPDWEDEGDYSFTITAYGYDDEEPQSFTVNLTIEHGDAPPFIQNRPNHTTEETVPISVNILDPRYVDEFDIDGDKVVLLPETVKLRKNEAGEIGLGQLEVTQTGFTYTPMVGDAKFVLVEYQVSDGKGNIFMVGRNFNEIPAIGINVESYKDITIEQTSSGGSFGGAMLALIALIFGARITKRKAQ